MVDIPGFCLGIAALLGMGKSSHKLHCLCFTIVTLLCVDFGLLWGDRAPRNQGKPPLLAQSVHLLGSSPCKASPWDLKVVLLSPPGECDH